MGDLWISDTGYLGDGELDVRERGHISYRNLVRHEDVNRTASP